jgi:transposase-like protein
LTRLGGQPRIWRQRSPHAKQCRGALHGGVQGRGGSASTLLSEEVHPPEPAYELNLADQTLRNWIERAEIARGEREGQTTEEREELRRSRWENKILREERELLKKPYGLLRKGRRDIRRAHISSSRRRRGPLTPSLCSAGFLVSLAVSASLEEQTAVREPAWTQCSRRRSRQPTATATPPTALPGCTPSSGSSVSVAAESGSPDSCVAQGHAGLRGRGIKTTHRYHPPAGRSGLKGRANKERVGTKLAASHSIIWAGTAAPKTRPQCRHSPIGASS